MTDALIYDALRTPRGAGRPSGGLHTLSPIELGASVLTALAARTNCDRVEIDDVIFGCGSLTGNSAVVAAAQANAYAIGVDTDQYLTLPEAAPRMLSSAMKLIAPGVFELIKLSREGAFPSGNYLGEVSYAPFHALENEVPAEVKAEMEKINAGLLDGSIRTNVPPEKP